jgi:hypothetical protein
MTRPGVVLASDDDAATCEEPEAPLAHHGHTVETAARWSSGAGADGLRAVQRSRAARGLYRTSSRGVGAVAHLTEPFAPNASPRRSSGCSWPPEGG